MKPQQLISFLRHCYIADNREAKLLDVFDKNKINFLNFIEGTEELANQHFPKIPIPNEYAEKILSALQLSSKDKNLVYGSLFLIGKNLTEENGSRVCAPLLLFPCSIHTKNGFAYASIDYSNPKINESAFDLIKHSFDKKTYPDLSKLRTSSLNFKQVSAICSLLNSWAPEVNTDKCLLFPRLTRATTIKRLLQPKQREKISGYELISASAIFLSVHSKNTFGIVSELTKLAESNRYSSAINSLFRKENKHITLENNSFFLPTVLNNAQRKAVTNSHTFSKSLIIGPPGTGKSYTIANIAIDYFMKGKSVLITAKQDEAVDVIAEKIANLIDNDEVLIRGGAKGNRWKMTKLLRKHLNMMDPKESYQLEELEKEHHRVEKQLKQLENRLKRRITQEIQWSKNLTSDLFIDKMKSFLIENTHRWHTAHWTLLQEINALTAEKISIQKQLIEAKHKNSIWRTLSTERELIEHLYQSITSHKINQWEELQNQINYPQLIKTFPIWLTKTTDCYRILPLEKNLFDLVIIDEASQCDLASVLPAIQRAKNVVVVGDPNQLKHVSFLSSLKQAQIAKHLNIYQNSISQLNYRTTSFLDFFSQQLTSQNQVTFLNEHYRSYPSIIDFSNQNIYHGRLKILKHEVHKNQKTGIILHKTAGSRNVKGFNASETKKIVSILTKIVHKYQSTAASEKPSIGVLSPFRDQVQHLSQEISSNFNYDSIESHRIIVGTPFSFQGEERDIMLLSFSVCNKSHFASFNYASKPDILNVAITRAKTIQHIIYSFRPESLDDNQLLKLYFNHIQKKTNSAKSNTTTVYESFIQEVIDFIQQLGKNYFVDFEIAGIQIDIAVQTENQLIGIDLIGYPGKYEEAINVENYKIISRANFPIFPLSYSFWKFQPQQTRSQLQHFLESNYL